MNRKLLPLAAAALLSLPAALFSSSAWAARDFTPQSGTWVVSSEVDGQPGRGLAIDVQGNTFYMQVFDYRPDGSATFHAAMGAMQGNTVTAPLHSYRGGRYFGGPAQYGEVDSSPGNVTLNFSDGLHGTIELPGEAPVAIRRFLVRDPAEKYPTAFDREFMTRALLLVGLDGQGQPQLAFSGEARTDNESVVYLNLQQNISPYSSAQQRLRCLASPQNSDVLDCVPFSVFPEGTDKDSIHYVQAAQLRRAANGIQGSLRVQLPRSAGAAVREYQLMGSSAYGAQGARFFENKFYRAGPYFIDRNTCSDACVDADSRQESLYLPPASTWIVADELTGKPGRGIALDMQDTMAVVQVFNYTADGKASFHMASGPYREPTITMALNRYQGGRYLGGPARSGSWLESAGPLSIDMSPLAQQDLYLSGMLRLPGEPARLMRKLVVDYTPSLQEQLYGQWYLQFSPHNGAGRFVTFDRTIDGRVSNADASVGCGVEPDSPQLITCTWHRDTAQGGPLKIGLPPSVLVGNVAAYAMRIRDRFGNLTGLGPLPQ